MSNLAVLGLSNSHFLRSQIDIVISRRLFQAGFALQFPWCLCMELRYCCSFGDVSPAGPYSAKAAMLGTPFVIEAIRRCSSFSSFRNYHKQPRVHRHLYGQPSATLFFQANGAHHCSGRHSDGLLICLPPAMNPQVSSHRTLACLFGTGRNIDSVFYWFSKVSVCSSPSASVMSRHNQETILAVHQQNSWFHIGNDVEIRKEKESGFLRSGNSFHAADTSHAQPRASSLKG